MPPSPSLADILTFLGVCVTAVMAYLARNVDTGQRKKTSEKLGVEIEASTQEMLITSVQLVREDVGRLQTANAELRNSLKIIEAQDREKGIRIRTLEDDIEKLSHTNENLSLQGERHRNRIAELETQAGVQHTDTEKMKLKIRELGITVQQQQKQIEELEKENETLWEGLNTLTAQVKELGHEPRFTPPARNKKAKATGGT